MAYLCALNVSVIFFIIIIIDNLGDLSIVFLSKMSFFIIDLMI